MQEVTTGMRKKGNSSMKWIERDKEKECKTKTLGTDKWENIDTLYINQ
jgi:hypothetical protein